ncbi:MAG: hypothetical protein B7C24_10290 [Bacteroidetes bacterium 4572_77]|nr:MAG: hypothetical protein B7C24_10290 [Bacteroidetes bacterium 4572_77]
MPKSIYSIFLFVFFGFYFFPVFSQAQTTKIMGKVIDKTTHEPIPFANVYLKNTTVGVSAGFNGEFSMEVEVFSDTLIASALGYNKGFVLIKKGIFQKVVFQLSVSEVSLNEVEVFAEMDPALIIFNKMIENKSRNNPREFDFFEYRLYNKIELDANNVNERFQNNRFMKKFQFIFQYVDTSVVNGKAYLPVFLSESVSRVYQRARPKTTKEIIVASKISGFDNESISQFTGGLYQQVNIYDNYIIAFEKNFVSPASDFGRTSYDYVVIDTVILNQKNCFHLMFKPKRKQELTFVGEIWVHDSTFAVAKVDMKSASDANINFVNDIAISLEYDVANGKYWVLSKDRIILDINAIENSMKIPGFFARRSSHYSDFKFNEKPPDSIFSRPVHITLAKGHRDYSSDFWSNNRDVPLNKNEKGVYSMIDSVENVPIFKTYTDVIYLLTAGYLNWGKFEIGPTFNGLSYNTNEGVRIRLGGRTNKNFSTRLRLHGYLAYGFDDEQIKGSGGAYYLLRKDPYRKIGADFKYDLEQLGQRNVAFTDDNFISSLLRRSPNDKQSLVEGYKIYYDHEWFTGFSSKISFNQRKMYPVGGLKFEIWDGEQYTEIDAIRTSELSLKMRFAYKEKYFMGAFERMSLGTSYPIFEINLTYGIPKLFASKEEYFRFIFQTKQQFNVFNIGWSKYVFEVGKLWGTVPYPLLEIAPGNQTLVSDQYAYNLMNYYEFINDQYASVFYTHHFDGLVFNHIPFLRKLNWREVIHAKGIIGNISNKNLHYSIFPSYSYSLTRPYYEVGAG